MNAVVNTPSNYRNLNGLTFPIVEFQLDTKMPQIILEIDTEFGKREATFLIDEVVITDLQKEFATAKHCYFFGGPSFGKGVHYNDLQKYMRLRKIKLTAEVLVAMAN